MNILILSAGRKKQSSEDDYPLCLAEFNGKLLIQLLAEQCLVLNPSSIIIALQDDEVRKYHLDHIIALLIPQARTLNIHFKTQGAACTALLASKYIDNDEELLIVNANELLNISFVEVLNNFRDRQMQAGVVVFDSIHPRYSYVRLDEYGCVIEAAEKRPISRHATAGFYWYAEGSKFVEAAKNMIRKDASVNNNFYICPVFNELILSQVSIATYVIDTNKYYPLKTNRQLDRVEIAIERSRKHEYL
jgi:dTDP-glucose pyrophosphorylase